MSIPYTYWQDPADGMWLGYWNDYPDHMTQGYSFDELLFMLRDLRSFINSGEIGEEPKHCGVMEFA